MVQMLGLVIAICYRLRSQSSLSNIAGLLVGMLIMAVSSIVCLFLDPSWGMIQGVALVAVAIGTTLSLGDHQTTSF
jgi:hypothetical protein